MRRKTNHSTEQSKTVNLTDLQKLFMVWEQKNPGKSFEDFLLARKAVIDRHNEKNRLSLNLVRTPEGVFVSANQLSPTER